MDLWLASRSLDFCYIYLLVLRWSTYLISTAQVSSCWGSYLCIIPKALIVSEKCSMIVLSIYCFLQTCCLRLGMQIAGPASGILAEGVILSEFCKGMRDIDSSEEEASKIWSQWKSSLSLIQWGALEQKTVPRNCQLLRKQEFFSIPVLVN